jgi:hypothetical protein
MTVALVEVAVTQADTISNAFLAHGALGALCLVQFGAIVALFRALMQAKDDRIADGKALAETLVKATERYNDAVTTMAGTQDKIIAAAQQKGSRS